MNEAERDRLVELTREQNKWLERHEFEGRYDHTEADEVDKNVHYVYADPTHSIDEVIAKMDEANQTEETLKTELRK